MPSKQPIHTAIGSPGYFPRDVQAEITDTIIEAIETGKDTGIFKGVWKNSDYGPELDLIEIEGKWSKPDGSKVTEYRVWQQPLEFTIATRAVHGGKIALRLLTATALIFFVERAFSPFVLHVLDPVALGLHELAAFVAIAVALASASALRASRARHEGDVASLEAA